MELNTSFLSLGEGIELTSLVGPLWSREEENWDIKLIIRSNEKENTEAKLLMYDNTQYRRNYVKTYGGNNVETYRGNDGGIFKSKLLFSKCIYYLRVNYYYLSVYVI